MYDLIDKWELHLEVEQLFHHLDKLGVHYVELDESLEQDHHVSTLSLHLALHQRVCEDVHGSLLELGRHSRIAVEHNLCGLLLPLGFGLTLIFGVDVPQQLVVVGLAIARQVVLVAHEEGVVVAPCDHLLLRFQHFLLHLHKVREESVEVARRHQFDGA